MKRSKISILATIVKSFFGIKDFSIFTKRIKKKVGKLIYKKKYTSLDIVNIMCNLGMKEGSIVCIHSSMMEFYNYNGTATDLINEIIKKIGKNGTLIMPAYPNQEIAESNGYIFDKENDKTVAGFLAETFRQYPGVKRSINAEHSVCAFGKYADYLINEHHLSENCWDKKSPWYKMCELDALIFNLGMPRKFFGTFAHCVESILQYEHPYWAQFFNKRITYKYYDENRKILEYTSNVCKIDRRMKDSNITKHFTEEHWRIAKISNLEIKVFYSKAALNKMLSLGRQGISRSYIPSTKGFTFK